MRIFTLENRAMDQMVHAFASVAMNLLAILLPLGLYQPECFGGGFMVPYQSARGVGLANAQTAGVHDPSAVYYNPAALGEVEGNNFLVNGTYINVINSVENGGRKARNKHDDNYLATLFANYHIPSADITAGIGTYTPYGLATTYDQAFTRFAAERTELKTIYVTPAAAWHPSKYFSVGGGVSFVHASGLFSRGLCFDTFTGCTVPIGLEGRLRVTDSANAFAYNLGLLVKPTDQLKLGLSYRSRADIRFDNADVKFGGPFSPRKVKAEVRPISLPPVFNLGLFWRINPSWGAEFVYEYVRWEEFDRFGARFSPAPTFLGVPIAGFSLPQDWKNTSTLRFGSYYKVNKNWEVRAGFVLSETPIPSRTLNPAIPGADSLSLNAGIGYKWEKLSIDLGYMAVFNKTRKVTNNELEGLPATGIPFLGACGSVAPPCAAKDKYETFHNLLSLSFNYRF